MRYIAPQSLARSHITLSYSSSSVTLQTAAWREILRDWLTESLTTPSVWFFFFFLYVWAEASGFYVQTEQICCCKCDTPVQSSTSANQVNENNYFCRLLSFISSSCTHLAGGHAPLTHPLLFVFKSVQQRGCSRGKQHKFQVSADGTVWPSIMWNSFPVSCFMLPEAKSCSCLTASLKSTVESVTRVEKNAPSGLFFLCTVNIKLRLS